MLVILQRKACKLHCRALRIWFIAKQQSKALKSASSAVDVPGLDDVQVIYGYQQQPLSLKAVTLEGWSASSSAAGTFVPDNSAGNNCSVVVYRS